MEDPAPYTATAGWLEAFGRPLLTFVEPTAVGSFVERRVLFAAGAEVDFALVPVAEFVSAADYPEVAEVFRRGSGYWWTRLAWRRGTAQRQPAAAVAADGVESDQLTHDFWYHALWAAQEAAPG